MILTDAIDTTDADSLAFFALNIHSLLANSSRPNRQTFLLYLTCDVTDDLLDKLLPYLVRKLHAQCCRTALLFWKWAQ